MASADADMEEYLNESMDEGETSTSDEDDILDGVPGEYKAQKWAEKTKPEVTETKPEPSEAKKARMHRNRLKQRARQKENKKKAARGEEGRSVELLYSKCDMLILPLIIKPPQDLVTPEQIKKRLRCEAFTVRRQMQQKKASKGDIETALQAVMNRPAEEVIERIREDRREKMEREVAQRVAERDLDSYHKIPSSRQSISP